MSAMRATPVSTRRSDEISFVMNAKPWRSRSRNSGTTRMPSTPQTTASPAFTLRSLRQSARPSSITMTASMRWYSACSHWPSWSTKVRWLVVE